MKKEYLSNSAKNYNKKSDTELIDFICNNHPVQGEGAKSILDKRTKMSLQHLTRVIEKNNINSEKYNSSLEILTKYILFLTVMMTIITFFNYFLAKKQFTYMELATRGDRINQKAIILEQTKYCEENPESANSRLFSINGAPLSCFEVLDKKQ